MTRPTYRAMSAIPTRLVAGGSLIRVTLPTSSWNSRGLRFSIYSRIETSSFERWWCVLWQRRRRLLLLRSSLLPSQIVTIRLAMASIWPELVELTITCLIMTLSRTSCLGNGKSSVPRGCRILISRSSFFKAGPQPRSRIIADTLGKARSYASSV